MRLLKVSCYTAGALLVLLVLPLALVVALVDPNDFRDDIERAVHRQTGRELDLAGELKLSVFPRLVLQTGRVSLGEAPGFGDQPFVSVEEARASARLWPLLRGRLDIGTVRLSGARIRLITDEQGRHNWADLATREEAAAETQAGPMPTVAAFDIRDSSLVIEDYREKTRRVVRDFNLETGPVESGRPFSLKTGMVFDADETLSIGVNLAGGVTVDPERDVYRLEQPRIDLVASGTGYPPGGVPAGIRADSLVVDLAAGTLELAGLAMDVAGARLSGSFSGTGIPDATRIAGPLRLEPMSPREWLPKVGVEVPETRDPVVLTRLEFAAQLSVTGTAVELGDIALRLDDTTLGGSFGIADFDHGALHFDLAADRIDADRYLPPEEAAFPTPGDDAPAEIPVHLMRDLNARGLIEVDEVVLAGARCTGLRIGLNAADGRLLLDPVDVSIYGGRHRGEIGIDATGQTARISLSSRISDVDFARLFHDFFDTDRVAGKGGADIRLRGAGATVDDILNTLDGSVSFNVADGALLGADLWYEIRRARAVLGREQIPVRAGPARTEFTALAGSGTFNNGILANSDLEVSMQYLRVTGGGTLDLPRNTLDYRLTTKVLRIPRDGADADRMRELVDAEIPVRITGSLADPTIRPDIEAYFTRKAAERVDTERRKLEERVTEKAAGRLRSLLKQD